MFNKLTHGNFKLSLPIFRAHIIARISYLIADKKPLKSVFTYLLKLSFTKFQNLTFNLNRSKITIFEHHSNEIRLAFE